MNNLEYITRRDLNMLKTFCPTCNNEVEVLNACGAVSFFCNTCNELKSSKVVLNEEENDKATENKHNK